MRKYKHWIDGAATDPANGKLIERLSPASGQPIAAFARGTAQDVHKGVGAARAAFDAGVWADMPGSERAAVLGRWADLMQESLASLAEIEADESGKPLTAATGEVDYSIALVRYAAALAWNISGRVITSEGLDKVGLVLSEPKGVVALITPWNYPLVCLMYKLPYALAAGCSVVVKPSEFTSGTTLEVAALAQRAGVPAGVFNVVTGTGGEVGDALTAHPGVDMVSFTGSSLIGQRIIRNSAETIKRVSLELGGKSPNIVLADADLDLAVEGALQAFTINQGEECCAGSRLLVEKSIADRFVSLLRARAEKVVVGDPRDPATEMGPLIHEDHLNRVLSYVEQGRREGATLSTGGARLTGAAHDGGYYVPPTIFTGVTPQMTIFREEIFGPVVGVTTFETLDEAVALANDSKYGLAAGIWTQDISKSMYLLRKIRSGMIYVNSYLQTIPQLPFGGMKESGFGRENGIEGLNEFLETKAAFVKLQA